MELIKNNPYRLLGLLVGTSPKVILSRVNNLKIYLSADEEIPEEILPYGFSRIGKIVRNLETINSANSKLNISSERILNSIFWFYEGSNIGDKEAFESMSDGDLEHAAEIWKTVIGEKDVNSSNASALHNLSILKINASFKSSRVFVNILEEGILMQLRFIESKHSDSFFSSFIEAHELQNRSKYQLVFLKAIQEELEKYESISSDKIFEIVAKVDFSAKDEFLKDSIQKPLRTLESLINGTKEKRGENPRDAEIYGRELYENSNELIAQVKNVLGENNLKYKSISDKLADEILQCGIDFFNKYKDEEFDPSNHVLKLFNYAHDLAVGDLISQRVLENINGLKKWIENSGERTKMRMVKEDIDFIMNILDEYENELSSIKNAKEMITVCCPKINNIRNILGKSDEFYLKISTAVARLAQNTLIECVNDAIGPPNSLSFFDYQTALLKQTVESALDVTFKIGTLDLTSDFKTNYTKNFDSLKNLASQIGVSTLSIKEKLQIELNQALSKLREIKNLIPYAKEIKEAQSVLETINQWQFLRSQITKNQQIADQNNIINTLKKKSELELSNSIKIQEDKIKSLEQKIKRTPY